MPEPASANQSVLARRDRARCLSASIAARCDAGVSSSERRRKISLPFSPRSEEHTSELQSLMRISYAVFCLKQKPPNSQRQPHDISTYIVTQNLQSQLPTKTS